MLKVSFTRPLRYRGRPSTPQVTQGQVQEREEQPDVGGCSHASEELVGVHLRDVRPPEGRPQPPAASATTSFSGRFVSQRLRVENRPAEARELRQDGETVVSSHTQQRLS